MDNSAEYNRLAAEINRLGGENAVLRTMAWPQFAPRGSKQEKYGFMSVEDDKPGFQYPYIARKFGFMAPVETMQTTPSCECRSLSNGVATGVGIAVGMGAVAGAAYAVLKLLKR